MNTISHSGKILAKLNYLESEFVHKLTMIEDCNHYNMIRIAVKHTPIKTSNLNEFKPSIYSYFELIKDLEIYYNKKLKEYNVKIDVGK